MSKAPVVTGISPIEGVPGTKVIIRGENFGNRPEDLIGLTICGVDCLMTAEWKTSNKIIARNVAGNGKGDIIVTTVQGARGTSTVQFKGYQETMGLLKESAVWVDETIFLNMAFGRKRPMSPTSALQEDPLGLSVEGNDRKVLNEDLEEMFPGCSGDLSSTKFNPEWFLLENHYSTSYDDLRAGLAYLRRKVETQKMGQISFLKTNVGSVLEQLDTLLELKCKFESDIQEHGRNITQVLEKSIIECKEEADKLFEDVLQRKDRADGTRNALNVLHRFRFLLYLPVNIERHIQRGDYDVVINDYARAKSLFGDTQVPLFRRFYNEVEKRIDDLRGVLGEQLTRMPSSLEHQKKIIRNLHHLETPGDPAWQCLTAQHEFILHLLITVRDSHLNREMADHDLGSGGGKMGGGVGGSRHSTPAAKYNKIMMSSVGEWQANAPVRVLWVEEACEVLSTNFPDMWKLSQAYFGGELLPPSAQVDHQKHPRCKEMILELLHVFSGLMRGAIMPHSLDPAGANFRNYHVWPEASPDQITPWLPQVLRHVRGCYSTLLTQDLPNDALDVVKDLILDLRVHCLMSLFQQTVEHVRSLHTREKWNLEVDDENGGCTQLPHICENVIVECAQLVRETVLESGPRETPLLDHPTVHRDIITLIHNVIVAFAQSLEKLSQVSLHDPDEDDSDCNISENAPGVEAQLLITLSNCAFMRRTILPRLSDSLVRASYPPEAVKEAVEQASGTYTELQDRLFEAYLEERVDPIIGMIERSMYLGQYDWGKVEHPPTDVRTYVKEILINITHVHAEVVGVWPGLVGGLVGRVVEGVGEEMSRLITCVSHWSPAGALQAHIDLDALTSVLRNHMSQAASASFHEAREILPKLAAADEREKEDVLRKFRTNMHFLLACFVEVESLKDNTTSHSIV
ncbi:exocyst complex component 2-like [Penaeus japonicus]|uniref:exocyst complex component 2-like n=1 Tax=Penaeus japonicus TaxID=27405 RepID=UPI001C716C01|nr:exocyst complex component 2-like [Penaeus japonicus]